MIQVKELHNPSFVMLPFPTDRTAWRPFGLPMVLVVPHVRSIDGDRIADTEILFNQGCAAAGVRIYITDTDSTKVPVAGHDNIGKFNPDEERYILELSEGALTTKKISNGSVIENLNDDGITFRYTTRSGVSAEIQYLQHADYYDLSDVLLDIEQLPNGRYTLVYEAQFYPRRVSDTGRLICVDKSLGCTSTRTRLGFNHPGDILLQMVESTPGLYFDELKKSDDKTIAFYRPFSEILQDIHDEQQFLEKANWVHEIPPEHIPYLGYMLGWDLPYFPKSADGVRRALLGNATRLQKLKGTKRAVRELFDLFGFVVNVSNVWWSPDGDRYIGIGDDAAYPVTIENRATYEPILLEYNEDGYGNFEVPLINRPSGSDLIIEAYLVEKGSAAHTVLNAVKGAVSENVGLFESDRLVAAPPETFDGQPFIDARTTGVVSHSVVTLDGDGRAKSASSSGWATIGRDNIQLNPNTNNLLFGFNRHIEFADNLVIYVFAAYRFKKIIIPSTLTNLQSNRFDLEIVSKNGDEVQSDVLVFLIDFLFKIKAFHSLLRKIIYTVNLIDTYQVTDFCVGGEITQDPTLDAGLQQTPPEAIIPNIPANKCGQLDPGAMGFRPQDLLYRQRVLDNLKEEYEGWTKTGPKCQHPDHTHNPDGQDRVTGNTNQDTGAANGEMVYSRSSRPGLATLNGSNYCYQGRVNDVLGLRVTLSAADSWRFNMCGLSLGGGAYYMAKSPQYTDPKLRTHGGLLGLLLSRYSDGEIGLHYTDAGGLDLFKLQPSSHIAINRPSLDIVKGNLCFPGHRLPRLNGLLTDFAHPTYKLRPWDIHIDCACPTRVENPLNAYLSIGTDGDEYLSYDTHPYTVEATEIIPDISSLGIHQHSLPTPPPCCSTYTVTVSDAGGLGFNGSYILTRTGTNTWTDLSGGTFPSTLILSGSDWVFSLRHGIGPVGVYIFKANHITFPCPPPNSSDWTQDSHSAPLPYPDITLSPCVEIIGADSNDVTHAIAVSQNSGHPAVSLINTTNASTNLRNPDRPLFDSSTNCGGSDGDKDYDIDDGYPSITGPISEDATGIATYDHFPAITDSDDELALIQALGMPDMPEKFNLIVTNTSNIDGSYTLTNSSASTSFWEYGSILGPLYAFLENTGSQWVASVHNTGLGVTDVWIAIATGPYPPSTGWIRSPSSTHPNPQLQVTIPAQLTFTLSSEVIVSADDPNADRYKAYRLDCGCLHVSCITKAVPSILDCSVEDFLTKYSDIAPDQVKVEYHPTLVERFGCETIQLNRHDNSLLNLLQVPGSEPIVSEKGYVSDTPFPDDGSFIYKDSYGTIYDVHWESRPSQLYPTVLIDFITHIKEPRRWGVSINHGAITNHERYDEGTVTIVRQVFAKTDSGLRLIADGTEQSYEIFQSTFRCHKPFSDPFVWKLDAPVVDSPHGVVDIGPHWDDATDGSAGPIWGNPSSSDTDDLFWIDVFAD